MKNSLKKVFALCLTLVMCLGLLPGTVQAADSEAKYAGVFVEGNEYYNMAFEVLDLVNQERAAAGVKPLKMDETLLEAAMLRSSEQLLYFDHERPNGEMCFSVNPLMMGENIAAGQNNAVAVMDSWMNSDGHRSNILDARFTSIGIGCVKTDSSSYYWTQCFGENLSREAKKTDYANRSFSRKIQVLGNDTYYQAKIFVENTELAQDETSKITVKWNNKWVDNELPAKGLTTETSNPSVFTVKDGIIKAEGVGTATLKVYYPGYPEGAVTFTIKVAVEEHTHTVKIQNKKDATCTQDGYTGDEVCTICGEILKKGTEIPATGHNYGDWQNDSNQHWKECTCGEKIEIGAHDIKITNKKDVTCTQDGYTGDEVCTICGEVLKKGTKIAAAGHDYKDGVCTVCGAEEPSITAPVIESVYSKKQDTVKVTMTKVDNAYGYQIFRAEAQDAAEADWKLIKTIKGDDVEKYTKDETIQYTNVDLEVGKTFYYKVRSFKIKSGAEDVEAEESRIYSDFSTVEYMPAAVVFDNVYSNSTERVRMLWNQVKGSHGYQIWRMNDDGTYSIVKTLGDKNNELTNDQGATTAYSNTGLEAGKTYTYKMRAFSIFEGGRKVFGAYSDEIKVAVMPETPELSGESPKAGCAALSWNEVKGAAGYQIWMSDSADGKYSIVKSITDGEEVSYTKYNLKSGSTYSFKVRAYTEIDGKKTFGGYTDVVSVKVK